MHLVITWRARLQRTQARWHVPKYNNVVTAQHTHNPQQHQHRQTSTPISNNPTMPSPSTTINTNIDKRSLVLWQWWWYISAWPWPPAISQHTTRFLKILYRRFVNYESLWNSTLNMLIWDFVCWPSHAASSWCAGIVAGDLPKLHSYNKFELVMFTIKVRLWYP